MSRTKQGRILEKGFIFCPNCESDKPLEVINRQYGQQEIEICTCSWPEKKGLIWVKLSAFITIKIYAESVAHTSAIRTIPNALMGKRANYELYKLLFWR